jgi:hypothetical protein
MAIALDHTPDGKLQQLRAQIDGEGYTARDIKASQHPTSERAAATGADTDGRRAMVDCAEASDVAAQSTSSTSESSGERESTIAAISEWSPASVSTV